MNQEEKIAGMWWFSDQDIKTAVAGDLFIKERRLELNGSLEGIKSGSIGGGLGFLSVEKEKFIFGFSKKGGKRYTLEFFAEPTYSTSVPGYKSDTYSLGTVFQGGHFVETDKLSFSKYRVELPYLFEWINDGVISTKLIYEKNKKSLEEIEIKVKIGKLNKIPIFQNNDFKVWYTIHVNKIPILPAKEMNVSQGCYLGIESLKKELILTDFYSIVSHLERFLTIAIGRTSKPINYQAVVNNGNFPEPIQIFPHFLNQSEYPKINPADMNFMFSDIRDESQNIFSNWFSQKEKHKDVFNLFSAINSDTSKNLNNQFKDILSAIEGYVRVEKNDFDIDLDKAVKTLNEKLPKSDRCFTKSDRDRMRITRNKLTHIAIKPKDERYILSNKEKLIYFWKLKFLLEYSFLKDMGVSEELLKKFYEKKNVGSLNINIT